MMRGLLAAALLWAAPAWAASSSDKGTATALFLAVGPGARSAALGEAYSAVVEDASALYWNPAALSRVEKRSVHLMHGNYLASADFEYLSFAQNLGRYGAWGLGVQNFSSKGIAQTDANGVEGGTYSTDDTAFTLGWAFAAPSTGSALSGASFGVAAKTISSRVATTAHAYAFDLGVLSPPMLGDRLRLALTTTNLGPKLKHDAVSESLPAVVKAGASFTPVAWWLASLDVAFPNYDKPYVALGTEATLGSAKEVRASGRAGFNTRTLSDVSGFTGFSFGFGLSAGGWDFDYAVVPIGVLGLTHRLSISVKF